MKEQATEHEDTPASPPRGRAWRIGVALFGVVVGVAVVVPIAFVVFLVAVGMALSDNSDPEGVILLGGIVALTLGGAVGYRLWRWVRNGSGSWIAPAAGYIALALVVTWLVPIGQGLYRGDRYEVLPSSPFGLASIDLPNDGRNLLALLRGRPLLKTKQPEPLPPDRYDYTRSYAINGAELVVFDSGCCSLEPVDEERSAGGAQIGRAHV